VSAALTDFSVRALLTGVTKGVSFRNFQNWFEVKSPRSGKGQLKLPLALAFVAPTQNCVLSPLPAGIFFTLGRG
jgi:hypothetical protein